MRLEGALKEIDGGSPADPRHPEEFDHQRLQWTPEELVAYMEGVRLIVDPPGGKRGRPPKTTPEGWSCGQWLAATFAKHPEYRFKSDPELSELSEQMGRKFSSSAIRVSKVRKAQRARDLAEAEQKARVAADDLGEDFGANGLRISTRKSGTGRQRRKKPGDQAAERADRAHDAAAKEFLANAEPKRRRPK
jgi:hypothetical protein